jgi:hypothetical protein
MKSFCQNTLIAATLVAFAGSSFLLAQPASTLPVLPSPPGPAPAAASARGTAPLAAARGARGGLGEERQPRMRDALLELNSARIALRDALPDKGGFREKAIQGVEQAIKDVQAGIDYARDHPDEFPATPARGPAPRAGVAAPAGTG